MGNQNSKKPNPKAGQEPLTGDTTVEPSNASDVNSLGKVSNASQNDVDELVQGNGQGGVNGGSRESINDQEPCTHLSSQGQGHAQEQLGGNNSIDATIPGSNSSSSPTLLHSRLATISTPKDGSPVLVDASVASGVILPTQRQDSSEKRLSSLIGHDISQPPPAHTHDSSHHHQSSQVGQATQNPIPERNGLQVNGQKDPTTVTAPPSTEANKLDTPSSKLDGNQRNHAEETATKPVQGHLNNLENKPLDSSLSSSNEDNHYPPINGHDGHQQAHQQSHGSDIRRDDLKETHLKETEQQREPLCLPPPEPCIPFAVKEPGEPILVKRPGLKPLTIPQSGTSTARSPPPLSPKSGSLSKSLELSPTARIPFLGSSSDRNKGMDLDDLISRLLDAGYSGKVSKNICLRNNEIIFICQTAREVLLSQPTLIELNAPVKIVGDIHGQYTDLLRMFEMCGFPPSANFLFLGDYVDRGKQSLETILLLFCYKIKYPENFFLLRGNHECANVTKVYGFYDECKRRANIKMWKEFVNVFNCLPLAAVVANKIFCVHGGLSPSLGTMGDIRAIQRPTDVPDYGLLNDLLWSDPSDTALDWEDNERGVSYCFGRNIIQKFLNKHDFDLVCRAHMVVEDGYEFFNERTLVTVFSAPNYCGEFDNFGAVMSVSEELLCSFELLKPIDQATAQAQMRSLAATNGGWRVNKQRLSMPDSNSLFGTTQNSVFSS